MNDATTASRARFADTISGQTSAPRVLLVWDAPNMDMGLGAILGGRPTAAHRPRFDALGRWMLAQTAEISDAVAATTTGESDGADRDADVERDTSTDGAADAAPPRTAAVLVEPEATVFTNIVPGSADVVRPWVEALRNVGYAVFAKPKIAEDSDVDADMLDHIELRRHTVGLAGLIVASADGQAFREPLLDIVAEGIPVTVIGFREHASWALTTEGLTFVDLEDIPGVFREPLPRIGLDSLPDDGAWLAPFRPLSALLR
ncbi:NYN domain-containing protein [Gordonia sp. VNQ95]|uniref:NYN domain-containing protein n=1 Tax=Gordonia sp. VNQ95 TaxID=3156619 RepID=UPI0032B5D782